MSLKNSCMAFSEELSKKKLTYMEQNGVLDSSAKMYFGTLSTDYSVKKLNYSTAKKEYEEVSKAMNEYQNAPISSRVLHPIRSVTQYRKLKNDYNIKKKAYHDSKLEYKKATKELRKYKNIIRGQYKAVKSHEQTKEMLRKILNQKAYPMLPHEQNQLHNWWTAHNNNYNNRSFNVDLKTQTVNAEIQDISTSPKFREIKTLYERCMRAERKQKMREAIDAVKGLAKSAKDKIMPDRDSSTLNEI